MNWTQADVPNLESRVYIVTGANSGIGYETARILCEKNGHVVMACRSTERGEAALARIKEGYSNASAEVLPLDLSNLESVRAFATAFTQRHDRLDCLINNAGVMAIPRQTTAQGFEMQFGVNHLGHFALTARLLPRLTVASGGRIVNVSSEVHRFGRIDFDDLMAEQSYGRWSAYTQSKLANLLFTRRLQRVFIKNSIDLMAIATHPGYADTELQGRSNNSFENFVLKKLANRFMAQSAQMGALPSLRAAVDRSLSGGEYVGPKGMMGMRGAPVVMAPSRAAQNDEAAVRLWTISEELTNEKIV
ncbi:MAG: oxidoreductase [Myxococcota bacterium]